MKEANVLHRYDDVRLYHVPNSFFTADAVYLTWRDSVGGFPYTVPGKNYTYVGCHKDGRKRDLPFKSTEGNAQNPMTADRCNVLCRDYVVFGLQVYQCYML